MPIIFLFLFLLITHSSYPIYTIMINPAGDGRNPGRQIDDFFERGLTYQYAQQLKAALEQQLPAMHIIMSRSPGETIDSLHNANFANRLKADLCLNIHCFKEKGIKPTLFIYYLVWNPVTDFWKRSLEDLCFISHDQVHQLSIQTTQQWASTLYTVCCDPEWNTIDKKGIFAFPFKPLKGFIMPAVAIEIGLPTKEQSALFIKPLVQGIKKIFAL